MFAVGYLSLVGLFDRGCSHILKHIRFGKIFMNLSELKEIIHFMSILQNSKACEEVLKLLKKALVFGRVHQTILQVLK